MLDLASLWFPGVHPIPPNAKIEVSYPGHKVDFVRGTLENLAIERSDMGLRVRGSLPKYLDQHNAGEFPLSKVREVLLKLEDVLGIPLENGIIHELEIGWVLRMDKPVYQYLANWGPVARFSRTPHYSGNSMLYHNTSRSFQGYDKGIEAIRRGQLPWEFLGLNLLKIEDRYKTDPGLGLGKRLTAADLRRPEILGYFFGRLTEFALQIPKKGRYSPCNEGTSRDFFDRYVYLGVEADGGLDAAFMHVSSRRDWSSSVRSKTRAKLVQLTREPKWIVAEELNQEFEDKVRAIRWDV